MALLNDLRGIFVRRRPMVVDLTGSRNGEHSEPAEIHVESKVGRAHLAAPHGIAERDGAARLRALAPTAESFDEAISLVRSISTHLERHSKRADRLFDTLSRLPAALEALPEINRQNARMLEVVGDYLGHARRRDEALNGTLNGINESTKRHTEVLGLLQQQLDASGRSTDQLTDQLGDFHDALSALASSNSRTTAMLSDLAQSSESREIELTRLLTRTQKWLLGAMICCAAMSAVAIAVAGIAILT